jgi:polyisoprenoid-binding protein YceI
MFFKLLTVILILSPISSAQAAMTPVDEMPAGTYTLDKAHASLTWKVSHLGLSNYTARFTSFDATLDFNPTDPEKSKLNVTVDPTSLETDYPFADKKDFDKVLIDEQQWFNTRNFPKITFESITIERTGDNTGKVTGDLTFLGVTKPLTLDVVFNGSMAKQPFSKQPVLGFSATTTMKRSDWGMTTYVPTIGDEVELLIEVEFGMDSEEEIAE